jgi:hypothetical protein
MALTGMMQRKRKSIHKTLWLSYACLTLTDSD